MECVSYLKAVSCDFSQLLVKRTLDRFISKESSYHEQIFITSVPVPRISGPTGLMKTLRAATATSRNSPGIREQENYHATTPLD